MTGIFFTSGEKRCSASDVIFYLFICWRMFSLSLSHCQSMNIVCMDGEGEQGVFPFLPYPFHSTQNEIECHGDPINVSFFLLQVLTLGSCTRLLVRLRLSIVLVWFPGQHLSSSNHLVEWRSSTSPLIHRFALWPLAPGLWTDQNYKWEYPILKIHAR